MLGHTGFRPLWPAMLFTPWLLLGLAYLVRSVRRTPGGASQAMH
jgi:hypothetical protein